MMKPLGVATRFSPGVAAAVVVVGFFGLVAGPQADVLTTTVAFETQALELDSGAVLDVGPVVRDELSGADVRFAYHADRTPHAVVLPASPQGVELAFLDDVAFHEVTAADVAGLGFSAGPVDVPFESYDTVVVRTDTGALFKIGNALESDRAVTFTYARLQ